MVRLCAITKGAFSRWLDSGWCTLTARHTCWWRELGLGSAPISPLGGHLWAVHQLHIYRSPAPHKPQVVAYSTPNFSLMSWLVSTLNRQPVSFDILIQDSPECDWHAFKLSLPGAETCSCRSGGTAKLPGLWAGSWGHRTFSDPSPSKPG